MTIEFTKPAGKYKPRDIAHFDENTERQYIKDGVAKPYNANKTPMKGEAAALMPRAQDDEDRKPKKAAANGKKTKAAAA